MNKTGRSLANLGGPVVLTFYVHCLWCEDARWQRQNVKVISWMFPRRRHPNRPNATLSMSRRNLFPFALHTPCLWRAPPSVPMPKTATWSPPWISAFPHHPHRKHFKNQSILPSNSLLNLSSLLRKKLPSPLSRTTAIYSSFSCCYTPPSGATVLLQKCVSLRCLKPCNCPISWGRCPILWGWCTRLLPLLTLSLTCCHPFHSAHCQSYQAAGCFHWAPGLGI